MRRFLAVLVVMCMMPLMGHAQNNELSTIQTYIQDAKRVGQGRLRYMIWDVYDAKLYAPNGQYTKQKPVALSLHYLRSIKGKDIADKSAEEMRNQGLDNEVTLAAWHEQMRRIFPDVVAGTVLTGIRTQNGETVILKNGKKIYTFRDPEFGQHFFDIWLGTKTSAPSLRVSLLGKNDG